MLFLMIVGSLIIGLYVGFTVHFVHFAFSTDAASAHYHLWLLCLTIKHVAVLSF
jgi:hypothetical protein